MSSPLLCIDSRLESSTDMNSKRLKRKRFAPADVKSRFPRLVAGKSYIGIFDGHSVSVIDKTGINNIYNEVILTSAFRSGLLGL